jgi:tRNA U34 2-thiouridine synthase MnmA/TrmU
MWENKDPLFIIATNVETNTIYTGLSSQHPGLFRKGLFIEKSEVHWIRNDMTLGNGEQMEVMARIRYRQPLQQLLCINLKTECMCLLRTSICHRGDNLPPGISKMN